MRVKTDAQPFVFLWDQSSGVPLLDATQTVTGGLNLNNDGGNDTYLLADDGGAIFGGLSELTLEVQFSSTTLPVDGGDADFISYGAVSCWRQ